MITAREILLKAAEILEKPGAWTQGTYARNRAGIPCVPRADNAKCFCIVGAIERVASPEERLAALDLFHSANRTFASLFNDRPGRTQGEVVAALRKAAELAEAL